MPIGPVVVWSGLAPANVVVDINLVTDIFLSFNLKYVFLIHFYRS